MEEIYLFICAVNRVDEDVLNNNPGWETTKTDKDEHEYGIRIIRKIAEHYDGMADFMTENGEFRASVMLLPGNGDTAAVLANSAK